VRWRLGLDEGHGVVEVEEGVAVEGRVLVYVCGLSRRRIFHG